MNFLKAVLISADLIALSVVQMLLDVIVTADGSQYIGYVLLLVGFMIVIVVANYTLLLLNEEMKNKENSSKNKRDELSKEEIEERLARLQITREEIDELEEKLINKYNEK